MTDVECPKVETTLGICNARGLHARASAKFVKIASEYEAEVLVSREGVTVNALSIMGLLMLGAGKGSEISVSAEGPDAEAVIAALTDLVQARFQEDE